MEGSKSSADTIADHRLAIADGATRSSFSGIWAKILVRAHALGRFEHGPFEMQLARTRKLWRKCVLSKRLPWYAQEKARSGAHSTLLGLSLETTHQKWHAIGVGDSCVFQVREQKLVKAFPLDASRAFNNSPPLVTSVDARGGAPGFAVLRMSGKWEPGDTFYLMTDALACWFLQMWETGQNPTALLEKIDTMEHFHLFISTQRTADKESNSVRLENDDVTMISCKTDREMCHGLAKQD